MNFLGLVKSTGSGFARDTHGNILMLTGILAIPLMLMAGAAVDMSQALTVRTKLAQAVDAAALAVGASGTRNESRAQEIAEAVFHANYPAEELGTAGSISLAFGEDSVAVNADAIVDMAFLPVMGVRTFDVGVDVEVVWGADNVEVVMVLDNTGSMEGDKLEALKTAAHAMVDVLFAEERVAPHVKIGLVPFATSVNIGRNAVKEGWIDINGQSQLNALNFDPGTNIYELYEHLKASGMPWKGCVQARIAPYDTDDTPPSVGNPETRWVPYLWPDEPDSFEPNVTVNYENSYVDDMHDGTPEERQRNTIKYADGDVLDDDRGPNWFCPNEIFPLTNKRREIDQAIDAMQAVGSTNTATGLAWGMRVISPGEPFSQGAPVQQRGHNQNSHSTDGWRKLCRTTPNAQ